MSTAGSWSQLRRAVARRRWLLASGLVAGSVATALPALAPAQAPGTAVLAAAHDLAAGTTLSDDDLTLVTLPTAIVPAGAVLVRERTTGRLVAGAMRRGEPLTDVRLVGPKLLAATGRGDLVAVPVRLAEPGSVAILHPGDRVDVLAAATTAEAPPSATVVAAAAAVVTVPTQSTDMEGALVILATTPATAGRLAAAAVSSRLSVVLLP